MNTTTTENTTEKLQKVLASLGLGSRREIEGWISEGRITINGQIAKLGDRVDEDSAIKVDGKLVKRDRQRPLKTRVLLYHKPIGVVCSRKDPDGRPTVFDRLPAVKDGRWIAIGRLDLNTVGLLLFTNNGELANAMMHPSSEIEREYAVRVLGEVTPEILTKLKKGVKLDDGMAHFKTIKYSGGEGANVWYHVILTEGRNREVRRMWETQGLKVSRLIRVRFATVILPRDLPPGKTLELKFKDIQELAKSVHVDL